MRESLRRPLLFLITVGTGSLIIIADASIEVIVAGTVLAGFLALVATGALDLAELRPSRLRTALRERKDDSKHSEASELKAAGETVEKPSLIQRLAATEINLPGMLGTFVASIQDAIRHARAPESEKKRKIAKVDAMLDQAVGGAAGSQLVGSTSAKGSEAAVDPLASLADLDLASLDDLDLDGETSGSGTAFESEGISLLSEEEADAVADILKENLSDLSDLDLTPGSDPSDGAGGLSTPGEPAMALPPVAAGEARGFPAGDVQEMNALLGDDLSELEDVNLDEIEVEGEEHEEVVETQVQKAQEPVSNEKALLEELQEESEEDFDMVSFASGGVVEDDLITELKSEVKKKKFVEELSLVRELKGEKFNPKDHAAELEEILAAMKS